jgi:hypothetical protein
LRARPAVSFMVALPPTGAHGTLSAYAVPTY